MNSVRTGLERETTTRIGAHTAVRFRAGVAVLFALTLQVGCASEHSDWRLGSETKSATLIPPPTTTIAVPKLTAPAVEPAPNWKSYKHTGKVSDLIAFLGGLNRIKRLSFAPAPVRTNAQGKLENVPPSIKRTTFESRFRACKYSYVKGSELIGYAKSYGVKLPPRLGIENAKISLFRSDPYVGLVIDRGNRVQAHVMTEYLVEGGAKGITLKTDVPSEQVGQVFFSQAVCL